MESVSYAANFSKLTKEGNPFAEGSGQLIINRNNISIKTRNLPDLSKVIDYLIIEKIELGNRKLELKLVNGEKYVLRDLGDFFTEISDKFIELRNRALAYSYIRAKFKTRYTYNVAFEYSKDGESNPIIDNCQILLTDNCLIFIPEKEDAFTIFYNDILTSAFDDEKFAFLIALDLGEKIYVTKLMNFLEEFEENLNGLRARNLMYCTQNLRDSISQATGEDITQLTSLFKSGNFVSFKNLIRVSESAFEELKDVVLNNNDLKKSFEYLKKDTKDKDQYFGINFENSDEKIAWFLIIYPDKKMMTLEITTKATKTTYFFNLEESLNFKTYIEQILIELKRTLFNLNYNMDPISVSDEVFNSSQFLKYHLMFKRQPYMERLRKSFKGKVIFDSFDNWKKQVVKFF